MTRSLGLKVVIAAVGATAGLALAGTVVGTSARWSDSQSFGATTVRSGQLTLRTGNASTQVANYQFTELAGSALAPGSFAQAPLTVKNAGTADLAYRLAGASASNPTLGGVLRLSVKKVASAAACATGVGAANPTGAVVDLYGGPLLSGTTSARPLAPTASEVLCIRVGLDASAPAGLQNSTGTTTFTFTATST